MANRDLFIFAVLQLCMTFWTHETPRFHLNLISLQFPLIKVFVLLQKKESLRVRSRYKCSTKAYSNIQEPEVWESSATGQWMHFTCKQTIKESWERVMLGNGEMSQHKAYQPVLHVRSIQKKGFCSCNFFLAINLILKKCSNIKTIV